MSQTNHLLGHSLDDVWSRTLERQTHFLAPLLVSHRPDFFLPLGILRNYLCSVADSNLRVKGSPGLEEGEDPL